MRVWDYILLWRTTADNLVKPRSWRGIPLTGNRHEKQKARFMGDLKAVHLSASFSFTSCGAGTVQTTRILSAVVPDLISGILPKELEDPEKDVLNGRFETTSNAVFILHMAHNMIYMPQDLERENSDATNVSIRKHITRRHINVRRHKHLAELSGNRVLTAYCMSSVTGKIGKSPRLSYPEEDNRTSTTTYIPIGRGTWPVILTTANTRIRAIPLLQGHRMPEVGRIWQLDIWQRSMVI